MEPSIIQIIYKAKLLSVLRNKLGWETKMVE